ncbi:MAG: TrkA C-terminal domain-containing protein [Methanomethylophilus sp.]|nr:TrkA C-terminal domain-containing protein [Methanomethylophilus sp.]
MKSKLESMFLELKDTSEMMVDLAYSSLLYDNVEIAEEVLSLYDRMEELSERIQDEIVQVSRSMPDEVARAVVTTRLMDSILEIADAARSIADVVVRGLAEHPVLALSIRDSDTTMCLAKVGSESILAGKTLGEHSLATNTGMFVLAVRREDDYIFGPGWDTRLEEGDILIARGPEDAVSYFKDIVDGTRTEF